VITCEHGGNWIPKPYRELFQDSQAILATHQGFDSGALSMANTLATEFSAPLVASTISRLLVDLNRSIGHPRLHHEVIRNTSTSVRQRIVRDYYQPYRGQVEKLVRQAIIAHGRVIHLSSHSFTPELNGKTRKADIGLLYNPARPKESVLCKHWQAAFKTCAPDLIIRRNYPYAGKGDGLTSWFRRQLTDNAYVGIELEINQKHIFNTEQDWFALRKTIIEALRMALASCSTNNSTSGLYP